MTFWDTFSKSHAWGTSLILKIGMLGLGIVVVLFAGWPQPPIGSLDHSSEPSVLSKDKTVQEVPHKSIPAPGIFPKVSFESSSIERKKSDSQAAHMPLLVDLNESSHKELESLPGIGRVLAARIVSYRSIYGGFQDVGDLVNISGIGEKRLRRLEPFVTVQTIIRDIGS